MSTPAFIENIGQSSLAQSIQFSDTAFPWLESTHVLCLAIVFGSILIVDLRLLGFASYRRSARQLIVDLLPFTWVAFVGAAITGTLLFVSNAAMYWQSTPFMIKMAAIALAGINMAVFHLGAYKNIGDWDEASSPPSGARLAGMFSLSLWVLVIFLGRWIGFSAPFV